MIDIEKQRNLLFLLREGEDCDFSEIYNIYWDKNYYAYKKFNNIECAKEVVQKVFLTLWEKPKELTINNLSNYLAAMVRYSVNQETIFRSFFSTVSRSKNLFEVLKITEFTGKVSFKREGGYWS